MALSGQLQRDWIGQKASAWKSGLKCKAIGNVALEFLVGLCIG